MIAPSTDDYPPPICESSRESVYMQLYLAYFKAMTVRWDINVYLSEYIGRLTKEIKSDFLFCLIK